MSRIVSHALIDLLSQLTSLGPSGHPFRAYNSFLIKQSRLKLTRVGIWVGNSGEDDHAMMMALPHGPKAVPTV